MTTKTQIGTLLAAAVLAGCGGHPARRSAPPPPKLPRTLAQRLANLSDAVAQKLDTNDQCGANALATQLQSQTLAAVATGQVPRPLRGPLTDAEANLVTRIHCKPPTPPEHGKEHGEGKHNGHDGGGD